MFRHVIHCSIKKKKASNFFFFKWQVLLIFLSWNTFLSPSLPQNMSKPPQHTTLSSSVPPVIFCILIPRYSCFPLQSEDFRALCNNPSHSPYYMIRKDVHTCLLQIIPWARNQYLVLFIIIFFIHSASHNIKHTDEGSIYSDYWII